MCRPHGVESLPTDLGVPTQPAMKINNVLAQHINTSKHQPYWPSSSTQWFSGPSALCALRWVWHVVSYSTPYSERT